MVDEATHTALQAKYDKAVRIIDRLKTDIGQKVAELAEEKETIAELSAVLHQTMAAKADLEAKGGELVRALEAAEVKMGELLAAGDGRKDAPGNAEQQQAV